jgi:hypothetical protein
VVTYTFHLIADKDYDAAIEVNEMLERLNYKFEDSISEHMMIINRAQCLKWMGKTDECRALLTKRDWSALADQFILCSSVLLENYDDAAVVAKRIGLSGVVNFEDYCSWPVFTDARKHTEFAKTIKEIFGQDLISVRPSKLLLNRPSRKQDKAIRKMDPGDGPDPKLN